MFLIGFIIAVSINAVYATEEEEDKAAIAEIDKARPAVDQSEAKAQWESQVPQSEIQDYLNKVPVWQYLRD